LICDRPNRRGYRGRIECGRSVGAALRKIGQPVRAMEKRRPMTTQEINRAVQGHLQATRAQVAEEMGIGNPSNLAGAL
jgi:hypothetical protein